MSNNHQQPLAQSYASTVTKNNQLMRATVIFLFVVVVLFLFLYIYAKRKMGSTSTQLPFVSPQTQITSSGLDPEILKSLPVTVYKAASESKESQECAVCLLDIKNGEEVRLLPKCKHGFHLECIDMWFRSHSTCPLCRGRIAKGEGSSGICRSREGIIVVDIPSRGMMECNDSPLPVSKFAVEEVRSPNLSGLRTLTRLWSKGKMVIGAYSPRGDHDVEKGVVGEGSSLTHKTNASQ